MTDNAEKTTVSPEALPVFDREVFLTNLGGNEALLNDIIQAFVSDARVRLNGLEQVLAEGAMDTAHSHAHAFKGMAGNVQALRLYDLAAKADAAAQRNDRDALAALLEQLKQAFDEFVKVSRSGQ